MTAIKAEQTRVMTSDDEDFAKLSRARSMMMRVCEICDLGPDEAMNVLANTIVLIAVHQCMPREDLVAAVGLMYDAAIQHEMKDEPIN